MLSAVTAIPRRVAGFEFLVYGYLLVRHYGIEFRVVFYPAQISVLLYCHKRVIPESFCGEYIVRGCEFLRVEHRPISVKEFYYDVHYRALSRAAGSVEYYELLYLLRVSAHYRSNAPQDLLSLLFGI